MPGPFKKQSSHPKDHDIEVRPFGSLDSGLQGQTRHFATGSSADSRWSHWGGVFHWNDSLIEPGGGIPLHAHCQVDVLTCMLPESFHPCTGRAEGGAGLAHHVNIGYEGVIKPGDVEVISVGEDVISHSEAYVDLGGSADDEASTRHHHRRKASANENGARTANAFEIWIKQTVPKKKSTWGEYHVMWADATSHFAPIASGFKEDTEVPVLASATRVAAATIKPGKTAKYHLGRDRLGYLVSVGSALTVNGVTVLPHDGAAIKNTEHLVVNAVDGKAEVILVDTSPQ